MAAYFTHVKLTAIFMTLLINDLLVGTSAEEKGKGISFAFPIEQTTLKTIDVISILDDVAKIGCWIHLPGNIANERTEKDKEILIQLTIKIGSIQNQKQNSGDFLIPVLLGNEEKVSINKYKNYLSDGLSGAARAKHCLCFINMFYWPLEIPQLLNLDLLNEKIKDTRSQMGKSIESPVFCTSFIQNGKCTQFVRPAKAAKFTLVFMEISENENVVLELKTPSGHQNTRRQGNFPQPFFPKFFAPQNSPAAIPQIGLLIPFVAVIIQKSKSKSISNSKSQENLDISSVWLVSHSNILNDQYEEEPKFPYAKTSPKTKSSEKASCYSNVMSNSIKRNRKNNPGPQKPSSQESTLVKRRARPDEFDAVKFAPTLTNFSSFLNSAIVNETWTQNEWQSGFLLWVSSKLQIGIKTAVPAAGNFENSCMLWIWTGSNNYKYITSDSVFQTKSGLQIYTTPFQPEVWTLLFVSMVITVFVLFMLAFVLGLVKGQKESSSKILLIWKVLSELCLWILRILLEQQDQEIPPGIQIHQKIQQIHQNFIKNLLKRAIGLILGVWLMMSVVLVNGYRGIIKSDYTLDFPFESQPKWNSSLDFLKDGRKSCHIFKGAKRMQWK